MIIYKLGNDLDLDAVIALYQDSMLGERRPITDRGRMAAMICNANVVVTAWDGDRERLSAHRLRPPSAGMGAESQF
jgi:hypothetical protein